jgi:hypothetical protein
MLYPFTVEKFGYTVVFYGDNLATVSGGRLPEPVNVRRLLGDGDANPKTAKNVVPTRGLSFYPADGIGFGNVCPFAKTCIDSCLAKQGQGPVPSVEGSRVAKTVIFQLAGQARVWFMAKLNRELAAFRAAYPADVEIGVRLNMFSDIEWERLGVIDAHPGITFYDYSKWPTRWGWIRPNYYVCFSYDGTNMPAAERILAAGGTVSVVFYDEDGKCGKAAHRQSLPATWNGWPVLDGGKTDWRPEDPAGHVVGLRLLARTYDSRSKGIDTGFAQLRHTGLPILTAC